MDNLHFFETLTFIDALKHFFENLRVPVSYIADKPASPNEVLGEYYNLKKEGLEMMDDVYVLGMVDDAAFNDTPSEITTAKKAAGLKIDYDGLLLFGVTLKSRTGGLLPTCTHLAEITRAFNRAFPYTPVTVIFRYGHYISLANAGRQAYKRENKEGEKVGKVTLLKEINTQNPNSAHLRILSTLTIDSKKTSSFRPLYQYWQSVFSLHTLNDAFYVDLQEWFYYASQHIKLPFKPEYIKD